MSKGTKIEMESLEHRIHALECFLSLRLQYDEQKGAVAVEALSLSDKRKLERKQEELRQSRLLEEQKAQLTIDQAEQHKLYGYWYCGFHDASPYTIRRSALISEPTLKAAKDGIKGIVLYTLDDEYKHGPPILTLAVPEEIEQSIAETSKRERRTLIIQNSQPVQVNRKIAK